MGKRIEVVHHCFCKFILGVMYAIGKGVDQNYIEAYKWLSLAGEKETIFSEKVRKAQSFVAEHMTSSQIAEAQRRASEWMKTHKKS